MTTMEWIRGGLIVSCQALEDEPLHGAQIMRQMAVAAQMGGAVGIRANTQVDCVAIREAVDLPLIAIVKREYEDSEVYITPTLREVDELLVARPEIIAIDATGRPRPGGLRLEDQIAGMRERFDGLIMADCSTFAEAERATALGCDLVSTTLSGYTRYSESAERPDLPLIREIVARLGVPVIAEGNISTPEQATAALEAGAWAVVVGAAITRPQLITRRFVDAIRSGTAR